MVKVRIDNDPLKAVYESPEYRKAYGKESLDFPLILDIEISGRCNMDCIMCARQNKVSRVLSDMNEDLFKKIIDQASQYGAKLVRFSGYGEALMNKNFIKFLKYAKEKELLTHLTTNGLLLGEDLSVELIRLSLDKIKFSFQGTNEAEYARMRRTKDYGKLVNNIKNLKRLRDNRGRTFPIIQIATTILDETPKEIDSFYRYWEPLADNVYHLPTISWRLEKTEFGRREGARCNAKLLDSICMEVRTKMTLWNDGKVSACCGDHAHQLLIGDIRVNTLKEIWHSNKAREIREFLYWKTPILFTEKDKKRFPLCAGCMSTLPYLNESKE